MAGSKLAPMIRFVLPHLISGQSVEHWTLSFLQGIQSASSPHFLRDTQADLLGSLVKVLRLASATNDLE